MKPIYETKQVVENLRPNSFQFRYAEKAGTEVKLYYSDVNDLKKQLSDFEKSRKAIKASLDNIQKSFKSDNNE